MALGGPSPADSIADINVTPLVDVMLVLLIIFMVTAPILQQGVAIDLPKMAAGPLAGAEEQLVVNIAKTGQVYLNDTPYTLSQLTEKLRAIGSARRDRQIYVRADQAGADGPGLRAGARGPGGGVTRGGAGGAAPPRAPHG